LRFEGGEEAGRRWQEEGRGRQEVTESKHVRGI